MTKIRRREVLAGAALVAGVAAVTGAIPADATVANVTDVKLPEPAYDDGALTAIYGGAEPSQRMVATNPWLAKYIAEQPTFDAIDSKRGCDMREVLSDWVVDHTLDHGVEPPYVNLTRAAFKQLARNHDVDWNEPLDTGVRATFQGVPIRVPGSKLDINPDASPVAARTDVPFRVAAAPAGAFVLDIDDEDTYVDRFVEHTTDESLDGREVDMVYMTRATYKQAVRDNMIDYVPDKTCCGGHIMVPVFLGRRISVIVGYLSVLNEPHDA